MRSNIWLFSMQSALVAAASAVETNFLSGVDAIVLPLLIFLIKALAVPFFFVWLTNRLKAQRDTFNLIPPALSMHLCIALFVLSFMLGKELPRQEFHTHALIGATTGISLLLTGLILMLTRNLAVSQILGFLVIENGIYVFALTQTHGMPLIVEMGVLLDLLAAVMTAGLLIFKIQKSFEHIDTAQLKDLKD